MKDSIFLDSNILIYSIDKFKSEKVKTIFKSGNIIYISTQVINEFINVCFKKQLLDLQTITETVKRFISTFSLAIITEDTIVKALELKNRYKYSFYDSLILSSSVENNCSILYSEDLNHSQKIEEKLTITNPFR